MIYDNSIINLLNQVSAITKKYDSIAEITGENFNVFKVLGLTTKEVQTHSAFLSELLDPGGSHSCQDVFLKIFIEQQKAKHKKLSSFLNRFNKFDTSGATATAESYIGFVNEDGSKGGRIDILIKDKTNKALIIENKINAGDQPKQLIRYNNAYKNSPIFYLTLNGSTPSDQSKGDLKEGEEFVCISYKDDIKNWLEQCLKEAVNQPILRETIQQYINLIKILTNQTINDKMSEEIAKTIVKNQESLEAYFEIQKSNVLSDVRNALIAIFREQLKKLEDELNLKLTWDSKFDLGLGSDCKFKLNDLSTKYYISFGFCEPKYFGLVYGIYSDDELYEQKVRESVSEKLSVLGPGQYNYEPGNWLNYLWVEYLTPEYKFWNESPEPWLAINDGSLMLDFKGKIKKLADIIRTI